MVNESYIMYRLVNEMDESLLIYMLFGSGFLGVSLGLLSAYVILKKYINTEYFMGLFDDLLTEVSQNKETQEKIYMFGAILGQGVKSGVGLQGGGKGGKFKLEDIIGLGIQYILPKVMNQQQGQPNQGNQQTQEIGVFNP